MEYRVDSLKDFLDALKSEDCSKIVLDGDISLVDKITIEKALEIDFNGMAIACDVFEGINITKGRVTLTNGTLMSSEDDPLVVSGAGATLVLGTGLKVNASKCAIYVKNKGKCIIDGAEIESLGNHAAIFVEGSGQAKENSTLEMRDGLVVSTKQIAVSVKKGGIFLMKGGRLESKVDAENPDKTSTVYLNGARTRMEMTGGEVYADNTAALSIIENATAILSGGIIQSDGKGEPVLSIQGNGSTLIMNGGKIRGDNTDGILIGGIIDDELNYITITDGVIAVANSKNCISTVSGEATPEIKIAGGRFHGRLNKEFIAPGYSITKDNLGYWVVEENIQPGPPIDSDDDDEDDKPTPQPPTPEPMYLRVSATIDKPTPVYGSPAKKFIICHLVGAVTVLSTDHINNASGENFSLIEYVLAGFGGRSTGYVVTSALTINK